MNLSSFFVWFYIVVLCLLSNISVKGQNKINSSPLETPIRFHVSIPTNRPDSKAAPLYENDWGVLILPKTYNPTGKPTPLVIGCHGGAGSVSSSGSQTESYDLYKYLVSLGYAVMDMAGMPESYSKRLKIDHYRCDGSFIAIRSYIKGYDWVTKNYNIDTTGCYITGGSNGGATATNIVCHTSIPVKCEAGMSPLLSLKELAWNITSGAISGGEFSSYQNRANVIRLYGMKDIKTLDELVNAKYDDSKVGLWDPFMFINTLNKNNKYRCPVKFWNPVDDNIVKIEYVRKFVKILKDNGNDAELIEMEGGGHSPEYYGSTIDKFTYQNRDCDLKQPVYELAQWFGNYSGINPDIRRVDSFNSKSNIRVKIFPNPFVNYIKIENDSLDELFTIKIFNFSGDVVYQQNMIKGNLTLNLSELPEGCYFLQYNSLSNNKCVKIIKK